MVKATPAAVSATVAGVPTDFLDFFANVFVPLRAAGGLWGRWVPRVGPVRCGPAATGRQLGLVGCRVSSTAGSDGSLPSSADS
ncbi:hypothetical protein HEK616_14430 [Streptomyces nigrescens]|uniref:Uncharacterized protein n=1 Tax=Streptomyces nigrescens TaxID=1920 RepID=A0ABM7ZNI6_STRNI|nr:hypothetical protein HEK616_14430 [Streptomyces nigrescens]